ncbi:hypothetical protein FQN54_007209 [Arachnomyces sp. PD_36]|nr:hypothetical protein FQN54_007209 [Arachnomyces sp. PD_36]
MVTFYSVVTALGAASVALGAVAPAVNNSAAPSVTRSVTSSHGPYSDISRSASSSTDRETLTFTVIPLPLKSTDGSTTTSPSSVTVETTCEETGTSTIATALNSTISSSMTKSSDSVASLSFTSPITSSSVPFSLGEPAVIPTTSTTVTPEATTMGSSATPKLLGGVQYDLSFDVGPTVTLATGDFGVTPTSTMAVVPEGSVMGLEATPKLVEGTEYDVPFNIEPVATPATEDIDVTSTSTIEITSTVTVVVATVTAGEPTSPDQVYTADTAFGNTFSNGGLSSISDDPFPEPYATMPPNVPPYVQQTTDSSVQVPSSTEAIETHMINIPSGKGSPIEVFESEIDTAPKTISVSEIISTVTKVVTVCPHSCEATDGNQAAPTEHEDGIIGNLQGVKPTVLPETPITITPEAVEVSSPTQLSAANPLPQTSTDLVIGPFPTIYSYQPPYNTLNTLLTQEGKIRTTGSSSAAEDLSDSSVIIQSTSAASPAVDRACSGYATLVTGLLVAVMLL